MDSNGCISMVSMSIRNGEVDMRLATHLNGLCGLRATCMTGEPSWVMKAWGHDKTNTSSAERGKHKQCLKHG